MAWRQRNSGIPAPRQSNRPVYEDFNPKTDTNENEGARIVILHVPGFVKEQMKITSEHGNTIRVQGQRALLNNKWSRFNQVIPVPTNCEVNKIHAKYHNGILTITMPKEVPKTLAPPTTHKPAEKTTRENISDTPPTKALEGKSVPPRVSEPIQKAVETVKPREMKGNEKTVETDSRDESKNTLLEKISQKASSVEQKAEKYLGGEQKGLSPSPQQKTGELKEQKGHGDEGVAKQMIVGGVTKVLDLAGSMAAKGLQVISQSQSKAETKNANDMIKKPEKGDKVDDKISDKAKESTHTGKNSSEALSAGVAAVSKVIDDGKKAIKKMAANEGNPKKEAGEATSENKKGDKADDKISDKAKESTHKRKDSSEALSAGVAAVSKVVDDGKKTIKKTAGNEGNPKKEAGEATSENKLGLKYIAETAKQTLSNVVKKLNDDDRQRLINIGAAVIVLVALGAYISYGNFRSSTKDKH